MPDSVLERVQRLVERAAGATRTPPDAGPDTPLGADGFWLDSVDLVEVVVACEQEFAVTFEGETDLTEEALRTIRTLAELISSKGSR
ncbi:MAG TPA: phosphopantetheine-binding protein [Methylomirabilota bacterium]|nr:phosphopantetheine-binding protein [Methylomirabilota bacterium]